MNGKAFTILNPKSHFLVSKGPQCSYTKQINTWLRVDKEFIFSRPNRGHDYGGYTTTDVTER